MNYRRDIADFQRWSLADIPNERSPTTSALKEKTRVGEAR
jgi:hypothetical protein